MNPFNKQRYARLMKGLDATELKLSEINVENDVLRIDAEYFGKAPLEVAARLSSCGAVPLDSLATVTDGIHTSLPFIEDGDVKVLSAKHPKENYVDSRQFERVSKIFHESNPRTALREGDVLVSTVGTIGNSAVVTEDLLPANSDRHVGIIRLTDRSLSPYVLSTFLITRYGRTQSVRETTGNVQPSLFISKIGKLRVPRFGAKFEGLVDKIVRRSYADRLASIGALAQAEDLLLKALGLHGWRAPEPMSYIRPSTQVFATGRLDAEFFSPKTHAIRGILAAAGDTELGSLCTVGTGLPWRSDKFIENGAGSAEPFVRIRNCRPGGIWARDLDMLESKYAATQGQPKAKGGDLVVGMDGLKYFYSSLLVDDCYINQRVAWLSKLKDGFEGAYLMTAINSAVGQSQLLSQMTIAQTVGHITLEDLRTLRIPVLNSRLRRDIAVQAQQSIALMQEATTLVQGAKHAVELAIEGNADSAEAALKVLTKEQLSRSAKPAYA